MSLVEIGLSFCASGCLGFSSDAVCYSFIRLHDNSPEQAPLVAAG